MTKDKLQDMTVEELRERATKQNVEGRSSMSKDELVKALSDDQPSQASTQTTKRPPPEPQEPGSPTYGMNVLGQAKSGKGRTQLYQTSIDTKEWLTKEEAEKRGFFWKDEPDEKADVVQKR